MYDWYNIFSHAEFIASGLVQRTVTPLLDDRGETEILITRGNTVAVKVDDVFLPVEFLDRNPYERDGYAVYRDADDNVWLGFEVDE